MFHKDQGHVRLKGVVRVTKNKMVQGNCRVRCCSDMLMANDHVLHFLPVSV